MIFVVANFAVTLPIRVLLDKCKIKDIYSRIAISTHDRIIQSWTIQFDERYNFDIFRLHFPHINDKFSIEHIIVK